MASKKKPKEKRVRRPSAEVQQQFQEQLSFLVSSCKAYDESNPHEAKRLALTLRILFHSGRPPSVALLNQVPVFNWNRFQSMMIPEVPGNLMSYHGLLMTRILGNEGRGEIQYLPTLDSTKQFLRAQTFHQWWSKEMVLRDKARQIFTRKDLVLAIADTDGGAHVDSELGEAYYKLSRENSLGCMFHAGSREWFENPVPPSIRQIAHEVLRTLETQGFTTNYPEQGSRAQVQCLTRSGACKS